MTQQRSLTNLCENLEPTTDGRGSERANRAAIAFPQITFEFNPLRLGAGKRLSQRHDYMALRVS
jgi:hypothetical protein